MRIQLALLLGIVTESDAAILRQLKNLRNVLSHRVNVDMCSDQALRPLRGLLAEWKTLNLRIGGSEAAQAAGLREIEQHLGVVPDAGEGLVLAVFATCQALFHRLSERVTRVELIR